MTQMIDASSIFLAAVGGVAIGLAAWCLHRLDCLEAEHNKLVKVIDMLIQMQIADIERNEKKGEGDAKEDA